MYERVILLSDMFCIFLQVFITFIVCFGVVLM